ncbi:MAG: hypothetical protein JEY99_03740 [Spirochaetales bacterium]|nr:hypothetical protein [Spirochaetales bacterium]
MRKLIPLAAFLIFLFPALLFSGSSGVSKIFSVAAVQLEIHQEDYSSATAFWTAIDSLLEEIFEEGNPDLIVIPEYTGVFYTLIPYNPYLAGDSDLESVVYRISSELGGAPVPEELFYRQKTQTDEYIRRWSERAWLYSVPIVAGTVFYPHWEGERQLRNRALVFDSEGDLFYTQDKVYLTDFELDICNLSPGDPSLAQGFEIDGQHIYLTICRDTFFKSWEEVFKKPALLWIDIKANGIEFDELQRQGFQKALPSRLPNVPVDYGLTLCLVGDYLNLLWEGESSLIGNHLRLYDSEAGDRSVVIRHSNTWDSGEILFFDLLERW